MQRLLVAGMSVALAPVLGLGSANAADKTAQKAQLPVIAFIACGRFNMIHATAPLRSLTTAGAG